MPDGFTRKMTAHTEIVVSNAQIRVEVNRAEKAGLLRCVAPKIFTTNMEDEPEIIIMRNRWWIGSAFFPGGLISDRTALDHLPAVDGSVFLIAKKAKELILPGLAFRPRPGVEPIYGTDQRFIRSLFICGRARALLENMRASNDEGHVSRTLSRAELEIWFENFIQKSGGAKTLAVLRPQIQELAKPLAMEKEAVELDALIVRYLHA